MFEEIPTYLVVSGLGGMIGFAFGFIAWKTQFCVAGSVLSYVFTGDGRGVRSLILAGALTMLFSQILFQLGIIDLDASIYRSGTLHLVGVIGGGLLFGYGMTHATGCGAGSLVRLGGGDLRSLIVLASIAFFGYMTLRGLIGLPRVAIEQSLGLDLNTIGIASQGLDHVAGRLTGLSPHSLRPFISLIFILAAAWYCFAHQPFRASLRHWGSSIGIALCVSSGWLATGYVGVDPFDPTPVTSLTFVGPVANTAQYFMTFSGASINFGIGTVLGIVGGSLTASLASHGFQWQYIDGDQDLVNAMTGGAMMGVGGVFAFGCSIGNGLTGVSTLSLGAFLAWAAILFGGYHGAQRVFNQGD